MKAKKVKERLQKIEKRLTHAHEYLAQDINVEGSSLVHLDDWRGKSGHPSWIKNHMIPTLMRHRAKKEKALETLLNKTKSKSITKRKRQEKPA